MGELFKKDEISIKEIEKLLFLLLYIPYIFLNLYYKNIYLVCGMINLLSTIYLTEPQIRGVLAEIIMKTHLKNQV